MQLLIQKWGSSAAVRLSTELLSMLKVSLGDKLSVEVRAEGVMLKAKRPTYALADLVAQCDMKAKEPRDMAAWNNVKPLGREV